MNRLLFAATLVMCSQAQAADAVEDIFQYLKKNVMNRTLAVVPKSGELDGGRLQYDYSGDVFYGGLVHTAKGFMFTETHLVRQTLYRVENGQRVLPGTKKDRILASQCELAQSRSIPERVIGFCRGSISTSEDPTGSGTSLTVELSGEKLLKIRRPINFAEYFAADTLSGYKPAMENSLQEMKVIDGKLNEKTTVNSVDLDLKTLKELPGTEAVYVFSSQEM